MGPPKARRKNEKQPKTTCSFQTYKPFNANSSLDDSSTTSALRAFQSLCNWCTMVSTYGDALPSHPILAAIISNRSNVRILHENFFGQLDAIGTASIIGDGIFFYIVRGVMSKRSLPSSHTNHPAPICTVSNPSFCNQNGSKRLECLRG